ncbi:MAG TPA: phosphate ABC transporter substrate-binding protein [Candidatus Limnocylindrales bacterium]|nr:phosphate ABC transporter substrate-binding protein [Candidatus Limnocylindrales bacterium]
MMKFSHAFTLSLLAAASLAGRPAAAQVGIDASIPAYSPVKGVSGTIKSVGSDTMNNEMTLWAEGFKTFYPNVQIEIEGKGSSTAPPALVEGTAQFGPMSRPMKDAEIADFKTRFGYEPTAVATSIDMLAVFVHKDNPIKQLTLKQLDGIFSKTRASGSNDIVTWGDLGLGGEWKDKPISLYGRNSASGTYGYFKEHALAKGDFKDSVKEQPGSSTVVQAVASDRYAIGYSGIGYKTADVRSVPLAKTETTKPVEATLANAYSGEYPLSRFLLLYVNKKPGEALDPLRKEFLTYVLSKQGQETVVKDGYFPLTPALREKSKTAAGLN